VKEYNPGNGHEAQPVNLWDEAVLCGDAAEL